MKLSRLHMNAVYVLIYIIAAAASTLLVITEPYLVADNITIFLSNNDVELPKELMYESMVASFRRGMPLRFLIISGPWYLLLVAFVFDILSGQSSTDDECNAEVILDSESEH